MRGVVLRKGGIALIFLAVLVAGGAFLRLADIKHKGVYFYDEADFLLRIRTFTTIPGTVPEVLSVLTRGERSQLPKLSAELFPSGFFPSTSGVPGHLLPGVVLSLIFGDRDWVLALWNGLVGTLTLLLVWRIAYLCSGQQFIGGVAALFLALSPYHVLYSRNGLAQLEAGFFVALSLWCYLESFRCQERVRYRWLFAAGLGGGWAVAVHYAALPLVGLLGAGEIIIGLLRFPAARLGRWGVLLAGVLLPLLGWEAALLLRSGLLRQMGYHEAYGYLRELLEMLSGGLAIARRQAPSDYLFYVDLLREYHGPVFVALVFAGMGTLAVGARRALNDGRLVILGIFLAWSLLLSSLRFQVPRAYLFLMPLIAVLAALPFLWLLRLGRSSSGAMRMALLAAVLVLAGIVVPWQARLARLLRLRSPYPGAAERLARWKSDYPVVAVPWIFYQYYLAQRMLPGNALSTLSPPYVFVGDWTTLDGRVGDIEARIQDHLAPFEEMETPIADEYALLRETYPDLSRSALRQFAVEEPRLRKLRFYLVREFPPKS